MSDKGLPPTAQSRGSVFSLFRGGNDRYSQFDDDCMLSTSPPSMHDFPEPIRFKPRKSKFTAEFAGEDSGNASSQIQNIDKAKIILSNPSGKTTRISSEVFHQQFPTKYKSKRGSVDSGSPHDCLEVSPSDAASLTLFEKAQQLSGEKLNSPGAKFIRAASDTNLFRSMAMAVAEKGDNSVMKASANAVAGKEQEDKSAKVNQSGEITAKLTQDMVDSSTGQNISGSFRGWLFGGKKIMNIENKDLNVIGPTSF